MWTPKLLNAVKAATVIIAFIGGIWLNRAVKFRDRKGEINGVFPQDLPTTGVHLDKNVGVPQGAQEEEVVHREHGNQPDETDNTAPEDQLSDIQDTQREVVVEAEGDARANIDEKEASLDVDDGRDIDENKPAGGDEDEPDDCVRSTEKGLRRVGSRLGLLVAPSGSILENAKSVYAELSADILARWGKEYENTTLFSGGMVFSDGGKVVEEKMLNAVMEQGSFVAAFTGISTTAGHDCLYEQSFPALLNTTMGKLMAATGVRFEATNVAMGNTRVAPYSFCVDAHAGVDADIISWEMSMMVAGRQCGPPAAAIEQFIRSASVLPRRPAVLVMDATPDQDMCTNPHLPWISMRNTQFMGDCAQGQQPEKNLMTVYREFGLHQMSPSSLIPENTCEDKRFARTDLFKSGKHYPHPTRWHPAPAGHLLLADMLFMHYAKIFLRALEHLEHIVPGATSTRLRETPDLSRLTPPALTQGKPLGLGNAVDIAQESAKQGGSGDGSCVGAGRGSTLPSPVWCKAWRFCKGAGNFRCANTFSPLAGREGNRLVDMVSERTPSIVNSDLEKFEVQPTEGHWAVTLNEQARPIFEYLEAGPPDGAHLPIDMKWVLVGDKRSGPIEFEFETAGVVPPVFQGSEGEEATGGVKNGTTLTQQGIAAVEKDSRVTVCKPDFIDRVALTNSTEVRFSVDGVETSAVELVQYGLYAGSCVLLAADVKVGRHTISVEPLKTGPPLVAISHMLYPA